MQRHVIGISALFVPTSHCFNLGPHQNVRRQSKRNRSSSNKSKLASQERRENWACHAKRSIEGEYKVQALSIKNLPMKTLKVLLGGAILVCGSADAAVHGEPSNALSVPTWCPAFLCLPSRCLFCPPPPFSRSGFVRELPGGYLQLGFQWVGSSVFPGANRKPLLIFSKAMMMPALL